MKETKFKDTEVGRIPEDWEVKPIKQTCIVKRGVRVTRRMLTAAGNYPVYQNTDYPLGFYNYYNVDANTPFVIVGGSAGLIGRCNVKYWAADDCAYFTNLNGIIKDFLYYELLYLHNEIKKEVRTASIPRLDRTVIENLLMVVPPKFEQSRIATALSTIDNLISELGKLIEKKRAIKQGAMQQLLTGKKRLKGFNEPWVEKKLGEDALILRGGSPRPIEDYITDSQDGLNWIKIGDVKPSDKYFRKTDEKIKKEGLNRTRQVKKGDFILSNSMSFGRPYILDIDGCIHDGWLVIQDYQETYDMQFLYYILCSDTVMNQYASMAAGSSVQNLNKEKVSNVLLYAPSSLKEQSAIAKVLSSMDEEISYLEAKREKYNAIKHGMMQQLLTGRIRLVETNIKTSTTSANVHFRRSVLAAEIANRLCDEPTFGHVKMEKMLFLAEHCCHIDIGSHYHRDAAGPYDNKALRSIDSQLKKQKWFEVQRTEKGYRYVPMQNRGKHKTYFNRYYSGVVSMFDKIINTFKSQRTEQCEIVATLYSAWEDLLHSNKSFTDTDIVNEVLNNWHESKKRISQDRWFKAIQWMRNNGFAPYNNNK